MSKGPDDIAGGFYLPCMAGSVAYDRVAGYFSSAIYLLAWPALRTFASAGGRIRLICSPNLSRADIDGLELGYRARSEAELADLLTTELRDMLASPTLGRPTQVLAGLVAVGIVELRLAFLESRAPASDKRLFHDKVGIFRDAVGDRVGFRGTMNETFLGLAPDGNLESIDIFPSWADARDASRLVEAEARFEALWNNDVAGATVRPFPDVVIAELRRASESAQPWEVLVDEISQDTSTEVPGKDLLGGLRQHQREAVHAWWANDRRGILEHATGSGKTVTAAALIREAVNRGEASLVVVPSSALMRQWTAQLESLLGDLGPRILKCGDGWEEWRGPRLLSSWLRPAPGEARIVLAVANTASSTDFLARAASVQLIVADEVHRLGSPTLRRVLSIDARHRLGLTATLDRAGDSTGTALVQEYFGGVVHTYSLHDAIRDGWLTPYSYHAHTVGLDAEESKRWMALSTRIRRRRGQLGGGGNLSYAAPDDDRLKLMLIERSRVAKQARAKVDMARAILRSWYHPGDRWLVYCDDLRQMRNVANALQSVVPAVYEYHSTMAGDQSQTLREFEVNGGVVVAIKCLDEGVDIPVASHALILASSRNPREFVQRRGRVLRIHPNKPRAHVHDVLVVPEAAKADPDDLDWATLGELARASLFARDAVNPESRTELEILCLRASVDIAELARYGYDDRVEEDADAAA
ncbi:MAG: DEAD/DEAH box helicase family protein [Chloroflexi bacterium]|nr:DEAD/DEAH box helicase family protein [Chloroflexota bacterium]